MKTSTAHKHFSFYLLIVISAGGLLFSSCEPEIPLPPPYPTGVHELDVGNNSTDVPQDIEVLPDGKILVAGYAAQGSITAFFVVRFNAECEIDSSFGLNGRVINGFSTGEAYLRSMAVQADGKIILGGYVNSGSSSKLALARYNQDGTIDYSFNGTGMVEQDLPGNTERIYSISLQTDGKIVATGRIDNGGDNDMVVVRFNTDGSLDNGFGIDEIVSANIFGTADYGNSVVVQSNGKIAVAAGGFGADSIAVFRFNEDGTPDVMFNSTGKISLMVDNYGCNVGHLMIQQNGRLVITGDHGNDPFIFRLMSYGGIDVPFMSNIYDFVTSDLVKTTGQLVQQPDGKLLIAAHDNNHLTLVRMNESGTMDPDFGDVGLVRFSYGEPSDEHVVKDVCVQPDGKILVVGYYVPYEVAPNLILVRLNANGSVDI